MSNVSIFETRWINLVFEGKNKEYGAYQLRQENPKTTVKALLIVWRLPIASGKSKNNCKSATDRNLFIRCSFSITTIVQ
ncbi:MAG: hypothetical protein EOO46_15815 [Flavobacterium sp.]|nr:MAG: hypothetical protein EOO46_15815 [Flavobacterium sp.]